MWWKNNKWKVIIPVIIVAVLVAAFFSGRMPEPSNNDGSAAPSPVQTQEIIDTPAPEDTATPAPEDTAEPSPSVSPEPESTPEPSPEASPEPTPDAVTEATPNAGDLEYSEANGMEIDPETGKDKYNTDPVPEGKPLPVEPEDAEISDTAYTCTLSISCATILNNMELCDPEKVELVPEDGWILQPVEVTFYEGESVFNVLQRVCKQNKIHMEFMNTPIYNSAYIEGIGNLYEFDVGELSGWMYKVNEWFPNYGCSRYQLQDGDVVCWEYTCELGHDIGGGFIVQADE